MSMKLGDMVQSVDSGLIYQIVEDNPICRYYRLEYNGDKDIYWSMRVSYSSLITNYIKVGKDGRLIETEEDVQLDWFTQGLPTGNNQSFPEAYCYHEWREYIGFTEQYIYCIKCDKKEEIKK